MFKSASQHPGLCTGPWFCGQEPWEGQPGSASGVAADSKLQASSESGVAVATTPQDCH